MTKTLESTGLGAREELRTWYVGHLRPMLEDAVAEGILDPGGLESLDLQLGEFFAQPDEAA